jgi:hypothetical protein
MNLPLRKLSILALTLSLVSKAAFSASIVGMLVFSVAGSSGLVSLSVDKMSKSSSKDTNPPEEGDYRTLTITEMPAPDGRVRVTLKPTDERSTNEGYYLYLEKEQFAEARFHQGDILSLKHRPYGEALYLQRTAEPVIQVLNADFSDQLQAQPVTL